MAKIVIFNWDFFAISYRIFFSSLTIYANIYLFFLSQPIDKHEKKKILGLMVKLFLHLKIAIFCHFNFCQSRLRPLSSNSFFSFCYRTNFLNFILQICTFHGIGNYSKASSCVIFVTRKKVELGIRAT
jgi:hypothetical protein